MAKWGGHYDRKSADLDMSVLTHPDPKSIHRNVPEAEIEIVTVHKGAVGRVREIKMRKNSIISNRMWGKDDA